MESKTSQAIKHDDEKLRWHLLPSEIEEVVRLLDFGASKYSPENWRIGFKWSRVFSALMRHLWAFWWKEESYDTETNCHHMASVALMALWLIHYDTYSMGEDDRLG